MSSLLAHVSHLNVIALREVVASFKLQDITLSRAYLVYMLRPVLYMGTYFQAYPKLCTLIRLGVLKIPAITGVVPVEIINYY